MPGFLTNRGRARLSDLAAASGGCLCCPTDRGGIQMSDIQDCLATLSAEQRATLRQQIRQQRAVVEVFPDQYDVALLGGGLAGLTLALQIQKSRPGTRIVVIEKQEFP